MKKIKEVWTNNPLAQFLSFFSRTYGGQERRYSQNFVTYCVLGNPSGELPIYFSTMRRGQGLIENADKSVKPARCYSAAVIGQVLCHRSWAVLGKLRRLTEIKLLSLSPELRHFYENNVVVTLEQSFALAGLYQGSDAWENERNKRMTASVARSQYTYYVNPNANWEKRYQDVYHSSFSGNADTLRGLRCEPEARERYEEKTGTKVYESGMIVREELPWLSASLDGIVVDRGTVLKTLEIKAFKEGERLPAADLVNQNLVKSLDKDTDKLRKTHEYYGQVQIGMLLSGMSECDFLIYSKKYKDFVLKPVSFDPPYVLDLVSRLINVYFDIFLPKKWMISPCK